MRVIHVVRQYAPSVGGLEAVVSRLAREQQQRLGHTVSIVTLDRLFTTRDRKLPATETLDGIPVKRLAWFGSSRYPICPRVAGVIAEADIVHVHAIDFFFDWLSATRLLHRKPLIASTHGGFFHTAFASTVKRLWFQSVTRLSATGYRRIVATSDNDGALFARIARRVQVIENGADIDYYRDAASPTFEPIMLFFGRWSSNKGLPALIALLGALRERDRDWRLIIAGRPYDVDVENLERQIAAAGLVGAIELHAAPSDEILRALMNRASYFVCLSRHEGFGIAAIEAMSAGLVPILSDIPPFRKIVDEAGMGLLLPLAETAASAATYVRRFHEASMTDAPALRERALAFSRRYEWSMVTDRYEVVYREAMAGGAEGGSR